MKHILVVGHNVAENRNILVSLQETFKDITFSLCPPRRDEIARNLHQETALTVFNFLSPTKNSVAQVALLRALGFHQSIMMLTEVINRSDLQILQAQKGVFVLEKPFAISDLVGVIRRKKNNQKVNQRMHRRHHFQQTVGLESFGRSGQVAAEINKISHGGAQMKLIGHSRLHLGEIVQLHVDLPQVNRHHIVQARVINCECEDQVRANESFGVSWVQPTSHARLQLPTIF